MLSFRVPGRVDLPVEVFDSELRLVGRALSSDGLRVDPGTYFVESRLPDGSRLRRAVDAGDEEMQIVDLQERPKGLRAGTGVTRREFQPGPEIFGKALEKSRSYRARMARSRSTATLVTYRLGWVGGWQATSARKVRIGTGRVDVGDADAVGLRRRDGTTLVVPAPGKSASLMHFRIGEDRDGVIRLEAGLAHDAADALLQYLSVDLLDDARLMADSRAMAAEMLLSRKVEDPLAAAAGALALLRMNQLDRLHDWTANLANWFEWLPDGAAIWAEHLGRVGRHEEAAGLLKALPRRGLPVLSFSLVLAVNRLRTYAARWPEDRLLDRALAQLTRFALATDFSIPITTFLGDDPDSPEPAWLSESPGADLDGPEAVDERREPTFEMRM